MPDGWREVRGEERYQEILNYYIETLVVGDFNGDGKSEGATIAISLDNNQQALLAFIYDSGLKVNWQVLDVLDFDGKVSMGVGLYKPGVYKVNCVTGAECAKGYKKEITINTDAFSYYRPEGASSLFIFQAGKFNRVWESD